MAGMKKDDISISLQGNELHLQCTRVGEPLEGYAVHRQERQPVNFSRKYTLPTALNPSAVEATLVDGILTLSLVKAEEAQVQEISID